MVIELNWLALPPTPPSFTFLKSTDAWGQRNRISECPESLYTLSCMEGRLIVRDFSMWEWLRLGVSITAILGSLVTLLVSAYHHFEMADSVKADKKFLFYTLGPLAFFMTSIYADDGLYHRRRFGIFLTISVILGDLFCLIVSV